ncbi:MAG TPA: bifunctional diaminohydroxyphosphoribosylaminopyrimidine deaminase/5-amino-6-(5-phosphoribosylamino)uracil reductase RibD [Caulobacteraceae bacterium]
MKVTLKLATSLDGRIATASGESRWITGPAAREQVHRLRAASTAVMVGVETVIADDPELTVRLAGDIANQPVRVVLDSHQRIPLQSKLVTTARRLATIILTTGVSNKRLTDAGVTVVQVAHQAARVDPRAALEALEAMGQDSVLIEGGGQVAASFLFAGLVDAIEWFRAPIVLGDEGRGAVGGCGPNALADAPRFRRIEVQGLGDDLWERYERL